ncbi:MAG: hypothetical protein AAGA48_25465 [Myxococcota bacterium]
MNSRTLLAAGFVITIVVVGIAWMGSRDATSPGSPGPEDAGTMVSAPTASPHPNPGPAEGPRPDEITLSEDLWPNVDWDNVRERTPQSLVWTETMPPDTDAERARRAKSAQERNATFGRIQAGLADDDEIDTYYDDRERLLTDNLEFVGILLQDYRSSIPERDQGLLEMSFSMTYRRLQQIPEERERAFGWKADHDARRAARNASP